MASTSLKIAIAACPVCDGTTKRHWLNSLGFELVRCEGCGHRYAVEVLPTGTLAGEYYDEKAPDLLQRIDSARERRFEDEYLPLLASVGCAPGRVLDVGCNTGELLVLFKRAGWQVTGIELSPGPARIAEARVGKTIYVGDAEQVLPSTAAFDLITLTHVLEHLTSPKSLLCRLAERLDPNGAILLEVPNANDPLLSVFGGYHRPLCAGDHVSFFDAASLSRLAAECSLDLVSLQSPMHARDVVYPALLSTIDLVRSRRNGTRAPCTGVQAQARYRGRFRRPARIALDRLVDGADPALQSVRRKTKWPAEGSVLIAVLRPVKKR